MMTIKATRTFTDKQLRRALKMSVSKEKKCDELIWLRDVMKCLGMSSVSYHGGDAGYCYFRQDDIRFLIATLVSDERTRKLRRKYDVRSKRELVLVKTAEP